MTRSVTRDESDPQGVPPHGLDGVPARPGRSPQGAQAMTAAQRQREYRGRCKSAVTQAIGEEAGASRVALLALLNGCLAVLDNHSAQSKHAAARDSARRVLQTLVTRYDIELEDQS